MGTYGLLWLLSKAKWWRDDAWKKCFTLFTQKLRFARQTHRDETRMQYDLNYPTYFWVIGTGTTAERQLVRANKLQYSHFAGTSATNFHANLTEKKSSHEVMQIIAYSLQLC